MDAETEEQGPSVLSVLGDRNVTMSNQLARAAHSLNLVEKRLIALGLAKTDSVSHKARSQANSSGWVLRVNAQEYAEEFDVQLNTAYEQLHAASADIFERYIELPTKGDKKRGSFNRLRWLSQATYEAGEGTVVLVFSPQLAPHLLGLRKHFTTYKLKQASGFDTVYAWRLFECLMSWKDSGAWLPAIEEFHEAMEAPPSCRRDFGALRARVIEPAVTSICTKSDINVTWKPIRHGSRRVSALEFAFTPDPQGKLFVQELPVV